MRNKSQRAASGLSYYAAQIPVLGKKGQERLRQARVHISGTGRIGTWVAMHLAAAGAGYLSVNDPQVLEPENFGSLVFAGRADLGKPKVFVLQRCFCSRPEIGFEPLVAPTQADAVDAYVKRCDLILSCANTVEGRLAAERKAIRYGKPVIQVAAFDGRERLGGLIALRLPENRWSACFGCYLTDDQEFSRGEGLLSTVTASLAAIASNMAVELLTGVRSDFLKQHNLVLIDLGTYKTEALAVERRKNCSVCGAALLARSVAGRKGRP